MKATFLDRDGVINGMVYHADHGIIDSPFTEAQFELLPGVADAIGELRRGGYQAVLVSNQPGMAKGHLSELTFEAIRQKMHQQLAARGVCLDAEYYCRHHPEAKTEVLRIDCDCRKPRPGLLLQAASELDIDLSQSWMIGDGLTDIQAGRQAGCLTVLVGKMKCEICRLIDGHDARPDAVAVDLTEVARMILGQGG